MTDPMNALKLSNRSARLSLALGACLALGLARDARAGADWVEPHPLAKGVPNVIHGSGLLAYCALTIDGVSAPILSQTDGEIVTEVPDAVPLPASPTRLVDVCFELAPCSGTTVCKTAFLGSDVFLFDPPPLVGRAPVDGCAVDVQVRDSLAFVLHAAQPLSGTDGLVAIDVSNPASPVQLGSLALSLRPYQLAQSGSFLYIANDTRLVIVDASDPSSLGVAATVSFPVQVRSVAVRGGYAYVAAVSLVVLDVRDPFNPKVAATLAPAQLGGFEAGWVKIAGERLLLSTLDPSVPTGLGPVLVLDVSKPAVPLLLTQNSQIASQEVEATCSTLWANFVDDFVATECADLGCLEDVGGATFQVGDLSDPTRIDLVAWLFSPHAPSSSALERVGDLLFSTTSNGSTERGRLVASDVSNPLAPQILTAKSLPGSQALELRVERGFAYVANCEEGLAILDVCALTGCPAPPLPPAGPCSASSASSK